MGLEVAEVAGLHIDDAWLEAPVQERCCGLGEEEVQSVVCSVLRDRLG